MKKSNKRILIIDAHPYAGSFCSALASEYAKGAEEGGHEVKFVSLRDLGFDPILHGGYSVIQDLESDLKAQQELITWCEHLVIVTPLWWNNIPALLKGYIDRVFLPGFAFKYSETSPLPMKLLSGRTASVIYTQGSPQFYTRFILRDSFWTMLKDSVLAFSGFSNVKRIIFDNMAKKTDKELAKTLKIVFRSGQEGF